MTLDELTGMTTSLTTALHREGIVLLTVSAEIPWLRLSWVVGGTAGLRCFVLAIACQGPFE